MEIVEEAGRQIAAMCAVPTLTTPYARTWHSEWQVEWFQTIM